MRLPWRRGWKRLLILLLLVAAGRLGWLALERTGMERPDLVGPAQVVDGDTLIVAGRRVRLDGVDAPESAQLCERGGVAWACGRDAALVLRQHLRNGIVACTTHGQDRYRRAIARCRLGEEDLGAWLVREGLAVAYTRYSWRYLPQELRARWERRGLWGGRFDTPEAWRRRHVR